MNCNMTWAAITASLLATPALAAVNIGDMLQINYLYPDTSTVVSSSQATYAAPSTTFTVPNGSATFFSGDRLLLNMTGNDWPAATFDGFEISDLTNANAFAGWALLATGSLNNFNFYKSGGSFFVHFLPQASTGTILIGTAVPEPSSWVLMIVGVTAAGWSLRSRRRTARLPG